MTPRSAAQWPPLPVDVTRVGDAPVTARLGFQAVDLPDGFVERLRGVCSSVEDGEAALIEAGRDWWPLAMTWAKEGQVAALPGVVARPADTAEVSALLAVCHGHRVPVTAAGGRSGVCGGSVPKLGGVALDLRRLDGIVEVADVDLLATARGGTNGLSFEEALRAHGFTAGHWPQSIALSSVGGWMACRSAGQYSTRYGKAEDLVAGLEVVLADGAVVRTGGRAPRESAGPDLTQVFVGSEGTLGVITEVILRVRPLPPTEARAAYSFPSFADGLDACRRVMRRGATPAVMRLYDELEAPRFGGDGRRSVLLVLDEAEQANVDAVMGAVAEECAPERSDGAEMLDGDALLGRWLEGRNDVGALGDAVAAGMVVDTCEVAARWSALPHIYAQARSAATAAGAFLVSAHQSHTYPDGACLYFTFAAAPDGGLDEGDAFYRRAWDAIASAALDHGGAVSHHHGIGLNRGRFLPEALGPAHRVLVTLKNALDPVGILNPGGLGLPSPFGPAAWP